MRVIILHPTIERSISPIQKIFLPSRDRCCSSKQGRSTLFFQHDHINQTGKIFTMQFLYLLLVEYIGGLGLVIFVATYIMCVGPHSRHANIGFNIKTLPTYAIYK